MSLGLDQVDAVGNLLRLGEVVIGAIGEGYGNKIVQALKLFSTHLFGIDIDLGVGERTQLAAVVSVLVGEQDLGHLLRLVAESGQCFHIGADVFAREDQRSLVGVLLGCTCRNTGIYQYDLRACIYQVVLQAAAIADVVVKLVHTLLTTEYEWLGIEPVTTEFDCFNFHIYFHFAGSHLQRTGDTMAPSFFNSANALSTTLRSSPDSSATFPAFKGTPALRITSNTCSFASIVV